MQFKCSLTFTILYFTIFFFLPNSSGQKNFQDGYLITLENDTLLGSIDHQDWAKNPRKVDFRSSKNGRKKSYTPSEIKEFKTQGEIYRSAVVKKEISPFELQHFDDNNKTKFSADTVFLQTIIHGEKSLFMLREDFAKTQYYILNENSFDLLVHKNYVKKDHLKREVIQEYKEYISQLSKYLNDCQSLYTEIPSVEYTKKKLEDLFQFYYECTNKEILFEKRKEPIVIKFGPVGGVSITSVDFQSSIVSSTSYSALFYLVDSDFPTYTFVSGGAFVDLYFVRKLKRLSVYNELLYTRYKASLIHEDEKNKNHIDLDHSQLRIFSMAKFIFPLAGHPLYLKVGISNSFSLSRVNKRIKEDKFFTPPTINDELEVLEFPRKYEFGVAAGVGVKFGKIFGEVRYEKSNGTSGYSHVASPTNIFYLLVGYSF